MSLNGTHSIFVSTMPFGAHDTSPLDWLAETGWQVQINDTGRKLTPEEVAGKAANCDGIIAGTEDLGPLLDRNDRLKIISRVGVGLDSVPLMRCRERDIAVSYTPDAVTPAVVEFAIGAMLSICRDIAGVDRLLRAGRWHRAQGLRLGEARIGLVGFGRIGSRVAKILSAFDPANILVCDVADKTAEIRVLADRGASIEAASFERLLDECEIISLHLPIDRRSRGLFGAQQLRRMRKGSYLVNTSRGGLVDETALYDVLREEHLAGAAIDVFQKEPYKGPLRELDNALVTAHLGSCSVDCRAAMEREATSDLIRYFSGAPLQSPVPPFEYDAQS